LNLAEFSYLDISTPKTTPENNLSWWAHFQNWLTPLSKSSNSLARQSKAKE
jgi:hypothetical protein